MVSPPSNDRVPTMRLAAATCVFLTAVSAANGQAPASPPSPDPLTARAKGRPDAPVTVYEMSDFQCPYCRSFALTTMPLLEKEYVQTGKVRFVYINLPLTTRHPNAAAAAELAMCAARQGKFWPLHDLLFQHQDAWAPRKDPAPYLLALGDSAGLDHARLARCVSAKATAAEVREDAARAGAAGAVSTPTFYIEGGLLEGAAPLPARLYVLFAVRRAARSHAPRGPDGLPAVRPRGGCGRGARRAPTRGAGVLEARRLARAHAGRAAARHEAGADFRDGGARQLAAALAGAPLGGARLPRARPRGDDQ